MAPDAIKDLWFKLGSCYCSVEGGLDDCMVYDWLVASVRAPSEVDPNWGSQVGWLTGWLCPMWWDWGRMGW